MYHLVAQDIDEKLRYKLLSGSVVPRPVGWITTQNTENDIINLAPFSFTSGAGQKMPLLSIAILRKEDYSIKDSARNLLDVPEAVMNVVSKSQIKEMNATAALVGPDVSEIELAGIETIDSHTVSVPGVKDSLIRLEMKVYQYIPIKDHENRIITDMFIFEVTDYHLDESIYDEDKGYIKYENLEPVARLAGNLFTDIGVPYVLKRPL
ncbi:flavin reductase family protein [Aerococcus agrisoli]|uniref:Flavin reductase family protein n=1 Tax=Aerococcus agrisoli TaxID=2487350 RepID=A0A3N4H117_9LACT|nr:flavin reductase family protein [Aerococcus agrisoli]RPA58904.1 flavin reductase family protein [Aerococcus agrisoli]